MFFQGSAAMRIRSSLFWDVTHRYLAVCYHDSERLPGHISSLNTPSLKRANVVCPEMLGLNTKQCSGTFMDSEDLNQTPLLSKSYYGDYTSMVFM
jgi:hypothetical protein